MAPKVVLPKPSDAVEKLPGEAALEQLFLKMKLVVSFSATAHLLGGCDCGVRRGDGDTFTSTLVICSSGSYSSSCSSSCLNRLLNYAIAGTAMPAILWKSVLGARLRSHWWTLPWPWSQLVFELSPTALLALAALPALAAGLVINLALIALGHYSIDFLPWLLRPGPGEPYHGWAVYRLGTPMNLDGKQSHEMRSRRDAPEL
jgi:hypothetical protein